MRPAGIGLLNVLRAEWNGQLQLTGTRQTVVSVLTEGGYNSTSARRCEAKVQPAARSLHHMLRVDISPPEEADSSHAVITHTGTRQGGHRTQQAAGRAHQDRGRRDGAAQGV